MGRDTLTGSRIRERRVTIGQRQADLARAVGISASYLNLIEHNRRRIGGKLLMDIAGALGVDVSILTDGAEAALIAALRRAAAERPGIPAEVARIEDLANRYPGWSELLADAVARIDGLERLVATLNDRLAHDPQLATSLHEMLSIVTSIRATASILADTPELEREWSDRFHRNMNEDADRLAETSRGLVSYLDGVGGGAVTTSDPVEELDRVLDEHAYHFETLEHAGGNVDDVIRAVPGALSTSAKVLLRRHLERYATDAARLPAATLVAALGDGPVDPFVLAETLNVPVDCVMRRIISLPADPQRQDIGLVVADMSGTLLWRKGIDGFPLPRFGAGCPLWPLFQVAGQPGVPVTRYLQPAGRSQALVRCDAIAVPGSGRRYDPAPLLNSYMLVQDATQVPDGEAVLPVGLSCRICPREPCSARRTPSLLGQGL